MQGMSDFCLGWDCTERLDIKQKTASFVNLQHVKKMRYRVGMCIQYSTAVENIFAALLLDRTRQMYSSTTP